MILQQEHLLLLYNLKREKKRTYFFRTYKFLEMKKIFLLALTFFILTTFVKAQIYTAENSRSFPYVKTDSGFALQVRDTVYTRGEKRPGLLTVRPQDSLLYLYNGKKWKIVAADSTGLTALINAKIDSVKILIDTLFYYIGGVGHGVVFTVSSLYPNGYSFDASTGDATITRNGTTSLSANFDGRYSLIGYIPLGVTPIGGTTGQILKKNSGTDYDYSWQAEGAGYVPVARSITINGTAQDLSLDRTWSVGTL